MKRLIKITETCFVDPFNVEAVFLEWDNLNGSGVIMVALKGGQKCRASVRFTIEKILEDIEEICKIINDAVMDKPIN